MMTTQQAVPIAFSGSIPPNYDTFLGPLFFEPFALDMAQRIRHLQPQALLEVAAGTGRVTKHLPSALPAGALIVATDVNPAMVNFAKERLAGYSNMQWEVVDAVSLPYQNKQFDCIASQFGVMFYSDRRKAYAEAYRVLRPGGVFLFNAWDHIHRNPCARLTDEILEHFFPTDTPAFYKVPFSYHDANVIREDTKVNFVSSRLCGNIKKVKFSQNLLKIKFLQNERLPLPRRKSPHHNFHFFSFQFFFNEYWNSKVLQ
jgi:ubiquinone/menaquinone biosynthesis C-methylase UbiE